MDLRRVEITASRSNEVNVHSDKIVSNQLLMSAGAVLELNALVGDSPIYQIHVNKVLERKDAYLQDVITGANIFLPAKRIYQKDDLLTPVETVCYTKGVIQDPHDPAGDNVWNKTYDIPFPAYMFHDRDRKRVTFYYQTNGVQSSPADINEHVLIEPGSGQPYPDEMAYHEGEYVPYRVEYTKYPDSKKHEAFLKSFATYRDYKNNHFSADDIFADLQSRHKNKVKIHAGYKM